MASKVARVIVEQLLADAAERAEMKVNEIDRETRESVCRKWCYIIDEVLEAVADAGKHD